MTMKFVPFVLVSLFAACKAQLAPLEPVPFAQLPDQTCRVTDFSADSDNQRFIEGNLAKRFDITWTPSGFSVFSTSPAFSSGTSLFIVTATDETTLYATEQSILRDQIDSTMTIAREVTGGQRSAQFTSTVIATSASNVWTLTCRSAT